MTGFRQARGRRVDVAAIVFICAAAGWLFAALLDRHGFDSHERMWQYMRTLEYLREWQNGHPLPQSFPDAIGGGGYAFPRFYPPFSYSIAAALAGLTGDPVLGVHLSLLASVVLSGVTLYWLGVNLAGRRLAALAAALLYVSLPYRFVDVFVRGAMAESWTFVWLPIVLLGLWRAARQPTWPWYLPVVIALLLLTHNITLLYFAAACLVIGWCVRRSVPAGLIRRVVPPVLLGAGLAAWFLIPQQHYFAGVWASDRNLMWASVPFVHFHRVYPFQLFAADPARWFGTSTANADDHMSFALGIGQLAVVALGIWYLLSGRRYAKDPALAALGTGIAWAWALTIAFILYPGVFVVVLPAAFSYVQFSWRLLGLAALLACAGLTVFLADLPLRARAGALAAALGLVLTVPAYQRSKLTVPGITRAVLTDSTLAVRGRLGYTVLGEYLPRTMTISEANARVSEAPTLDGSGTIHSWRRTAEGLDLDVTADGTVELVLPLVNYDFYRVQTEAGALTTHDARGLLATRVGPGRHAVRVTRRLAPASVAGLGVSALAALTLAIVLVRRRRQPRSIAYAG